ncbi:MAG: hydantoinase/oxoprolinase [Candidatus Eremiobacteraeota bacterium]|nr:hydantoinase/oxoprolinase [Candidatus Eremiobacteraeota bacterium]
MPKLRLGIDVGGTFTDVVAIDAVSRELLASVKVPTSHDAPEGVAAGIVAGIRELFARGAVDPVDVAFIAHSTTQATNALLEGDVARVAVIGLLRGLTPVARAHMRFPSVPLAPGAVFSPEFHFHRGVEEARAAVDGIVDTDAIAVSMPFAVDSPGDEELVVNYARSRGTAATAGHEVSSMYGLRARTRTAALNAAILPKMTRTAQMTDAAVRNATIAVPLMIMRSDGGVMDVREIERRPILTLLSGPAAGVAGALLHENVTDGIFVEVGGTSSDCSAIRAGMPQMRPARVGGHRTMLRTLDVRTLAIGGGSMVRASAHAIVDVGPRSAHIAGLHYVCFSDEARLDGAHIERVRPTAHDPEDYIAIIARDGSRLALTTTCAANAMDVIPEGAFARGNAAAARRGFELLAREIGTDANTLATAVLEKAAEKILGTVRELIADYELDPQTLTVIGGGGGAGAIVPYAAQRSHFDFRLARNAEVISPIGVALALVREVVERTIVAPTPEQIVAIRREAQDAVVASGASPDRVEVTVEIDPQRNLVRATATGATEMSETAAHTVRSPEERLTMAARLMRVDAGAVRIAGETPLLSVYEAERSIRTRLARHALRRDLRVLDERGVARLALRDAGITQTSAGDVEATLPRLIENATNFGDVGRALPDLYLLHGGRIADFSGLASAEQALALAAEELSGGEPSAPVIVLTAKRTA